MVKSEYHFESAVTHLCDSTPREVQERNQRRSDSPSAQERRRAPSRALCRKAQRGRASAVPPAAPTWGMVKQKALPLPSSDSTQIQSAMAIDDASADGQAQAGARMGGIGLQTREHIKHTSFDASGLTPMPLSCTTIFHSSPCASAVTETRGVSSPRYLSSVPNQVLEQLGHLRWVRLHDWEVAYVHISLVHPRSHPVATPMRLGMACSGPPDRIAPRSTRRARAPADS